MSTTNIEELEKHISNVFNNMFKSEEMKVASVEAKKRMGRGVTSQVESGGDSGYDYNQTGDFHSALVDEMKDNAIYQSKNSILIGFGDMDSMNMGVYAKRNFQRQLHVTRKGNRMVFLKEEKELPKWIIAEFGSGGKGEGKSIPKEFNLPYAPRPGKDFLYGPSLGNITGGSKKGYFMVSGQTASSLSGADNHTLPTHPGVKPGRIFRKGLNDSKDDVHRILGSGIDAYLKNH